MGSPPRLRPGLHVVRRDDRHLQVGLDPPWQHVVPDDPEVRLLLADLAAGRAPRVRGGLARRVLDDLLAAGLVGPDPDPTGAVRAPVAVLGTSALASAVDALLQEADVPIDAPDRAVAVLVATDGEPARSAVDEQVRAGRDHLVLSGRPDGYRVGPFVRPGQAACLRCVDAHLGDQDPRRAVVVEQLAGRPLAPSDPALRHLAAAWAVRDLQRYLAGERPTTWSSSVTVGADLAPRRTSWTRHPHCGCTWADAEPTDRVVSHE